MGGYDSERALRMTTQEPRDEKGARLSMFLHHFDKSPASITLSDIVSGMSLEDVTRMKAETDATTTLDGKRLPRAGQAINRNLNYQQKKIFEKSILSSLSDAERVKWLYRSMRPWQKLLVDIVMENNGFLETEAAYSELLLRLEEQGQTEEEVDSARRAIMLTRHDFRHAQIGWIVYTLPFAVNGSRFEYYKQWYTLAPPPIRGLIGKGEGIATSSSSTTTLLHQIMEQGNVETSPSPDVLLGILLLMLELRRGGFKTTQSKKRQKKAVELPGSVSGALSPANVLTFGDNEGEKCGISAFVAGACIDLGIVRASDKLLLLSNEGKGLDFVSRPPSERLAAVFMRWLDNGRWYNEFSRMGMVQCTSGWSSRPRPKKIQVLSGLPDARRQLCRFLSSSTGPTRDGSPWFEYESLKSSFLHTERGFASSFSELHFAYIDIDDVGPGVSSREWSFKDKLIDAMVEALYWLRVVELCVVGEAPDRSGKGSRSRLGIRITSLGNMLLGDRTTDTRLQAAPGKATGIKVTPDFSVVVPVEPDNHEAIFSLDRMLERTSTGNAFVYRITPTAIESSAEYGALLKLLSRFSSSPMPANVEHEVLEWSRKAKRITLLEGRTCVLLEDSDGTLYEELLSIPAIRSCLEVTERGNNKGTATGNGKRRELLLLLVRKGATGKLARELVKKGFLLGREVDR
jgi:XPB/Ssl2-like helicase family protein